ncbi:hypothetical protein GCM10011348_01560 [Marinobacterium nitratireducens]|uniref:DUF3080 domain-containing protein n=1 Tax=Marinobacterium nitratireducens TaxID=518897 RepID=A0A917Z5F3_9GAMM|nr:DUF3080 family protein [Marinobacterium nitratireducens]GGO75832.1 hypothetical protein GCM10011348_01560 [Marinobacterium nitratireducens]
MFAIARHRPRVRWLTLAMLVLLAGCDRSSPEAMLDNYSTRVARTIDETIDPDLEVADALPLFPARRDRVQPLSDLRQGLIEVLALRHCDLLHLIAERNSSLGKFMAPSQQLVYELRFFDRLRACRKRLYRADESDVELLEQVNAIYAVKLRELPRALWNAIYASQEMEANFSRGDAPLPLSETDATPPAIGALEQLTDIVRLTTRPDWRPPELLARIEEPYEALHRDHFGSQLLKSVVLLTRTLESTALALERREQRYPLCPQDRATPDAKILLNVFGKFYAGEVQPYLARVHRQGERWRSLHAELLRSLPATPAMLDYWDQVYSGDNPSSLWQRYTAAREHHTQAWQSVLRRCQLMPGS